MSISALSSYQSSLFPARGISVSLSLRLLFGTAPPTIMKCSLLLFVPLAIVQALPALQFAITRNGIVKGHDAVNKSSVWEYLGVPYAKSPVGVRRFAPPQKPGLADLTLLYEASKWVCTSRKMTFPECHFFN